MTDLDQYSSNFAVGMKVGVGIPLTNAEVFNDWALIHEIDEDLVTLQLSRDQLPTRVTLHVGQILELQAGKEGNHYSCRAIIVSEGYAKRLQLRLIGEIVSDELREFYRIDAFLPIKYYISHEQNPELLRKQWTHRRESRFELEIARRQRRWDSVIVGEEGELPPEKRQLEEEDEVYGSWNTIIPLAANISGGGLRITTHQGFELGEFVLLEILVPEPRRIVDAVVRVIFANRSHAAGDEPEYYNTGLQFVFIDERDRDSILNHISNVQLKRNRQLREKFRLVSVGDREDAATDHEPLETGSSEVWKKLMAWGVMILTIFLLVNYFRDYAADRPKNEIGEMFENALKKYIEKQK